MAYQSKYRSNHKNMVYALRLGNEIKIGCTTWAQKRMSYYRGKYLDLELLGLVGVFDCKFEEDLLRKSLGKPKRGREWFRYTPKREATIKEFFDLRRPVRVSGFYYRDLNS